jgi:DNA-binding CsgD family transcriptional regulator
VSSVGWSLGKLTDRCARRAGLRVEDPDVIATEPDLIERSAAEEAIRDALRSGARGEGIAALLVGTSGIGKTAMLNWATALARQEGFVVAHAVASPMERGLPFGLFGQAIVALGGNPVEDVAELARAGGQSARFYRTLRWLGERSEERPLVMAFDDLHWADADSLELLGFLCRRLSGSRVAVLGTLRPEPPLAYVLAQDLASAQRARLNTLEPLSRDGAAQLLSRILGRSPDRDEAGELWRACAGTPLLLEAAGRSVAEGTPPHQLENGPSGDLSLLLRRFAGASNKGFDYVKAGAILGIHFDHTKAAALSGVAPSAADAALLQLVRAGVLEDRGADNVAFVHPLFVQALLDIQPSALRKRQHAAAFALVVAEHGPDALAAEHAALAGLVGDPIAVEITARAGKAALAQGALRAASTHLENALRLAGEDPPVDLVLLYGQALVAQAEVEKPRVLCAELLARDLDASARQQALRLLARVESLASRPSRAQQLFTQAAAVALDPGERVEVLCDALLTCLASAPGEWVLDTARRALAIAADQSPQQRLLRFVESYAALVCRCDAREAVSFTEEVIRVGARAAWPAQGWNVTIAVHALNTCKLLENFDGARAIFEHEYAEAVQAGAPVLMSALAVAYADVLLRLGRLQEAIELVEHTSTLFDRRVQPWADLAAAVLYSELGLDARSRSHVEALREFQADIPPEQYAIVSLWLHLLDGRQAFAAGLHEQASDTMLRAAEIATLGGRIEPCMVPWAGVALDAHLAAGRLDRAREVLAELELRAATLPSRWPRAVVALGHAGLAAAEGSRELADERYAEAINCFAELSQPLELAQALISFGTFQRRTGRPRDAREPLARAVGICEGMHAERLARLARAELAASGGRRRRRSEDGSALTPQERRVAALAADGLANGQIAAALHLSPKTISFHLQRVYLKLGIHSRRDLIRRAEEFSPEP